MHRRSKFAPQELDPHRYRKPTCRKCGGRIVWVQMQRKDGRGGYERGGTMPCEVRWEYGDGEKTLVTAQGIMVQSAPPSVLGREPHFGNCTARLPAKPSAGASKKERIDWILRVTR